MYKFMITITRLKSSLKKRLQIMAWLSLACLLIGQLGKLYWILELFAHFIPYYAVLMALGCICITNKKLQLFFAICAIAALYWCITPWPNSHTNTSEQTTPVRFLSYNVLFSNTHIKAESNWLIQHNSDVIFLTETSSAWGETLQPLANITQHCTEYSDSPYGIALYSRLPLTRCEVLYTANNGSYPYIRAELANGLVVYGIHPPPPIDETLVQHRNDLLKILAQQIQQEKNNVIVLGDMNITAFSPVFRDFIQAANIHLTSPRIRPTWQPALLSIDHALVRDPNKVMATGSYSWQGSDHKPIWINYLP